MKKIEFIGNSDLKLTIRFNEANDGDDSKEYYNITVIHDSTSVGGTVREVSKLNLVPKQQVIGEAGELAMEFGWECI